MRAYDPPYKRSTNVYAYIEDNIADWIEKQSGFEVGTEGAG